MMKCGIDGRAQKKKRTRKEAKWKLRTRRDRSEMSRVGHFAHGPAHVQKKNCRRATDSIHCRVWCHDMFSEFRVFRNSGRWSAKMQHNDGVVNVPVVMHWPFPTIKKTWLSPSESFVKNQIACVVKMVLCGRKPWSMSSHLHYLLFSFPFFFFVTSLLKKCPFRFLTFSLHFLKKFFFSCFTFLSWKCLALDPYNLTKSCSFLHGRIFLFSWLFQG